MCLALVNLFTVSTVLYRDQRGNTAHLGKYGQLETVEMETGNRKWNTRKWSNNHINVP